MPHTIVRLGVLIAVTSLFGLAPAIAAEPEFGRARSDWSKAFSGDGWNTWDIERPNAMIHMPDGIAMDLSIYDSHTGQPLGRIFLNNVLHFGAHTPDGSYSAARYKQAGLTYEIEFAVHDDRLVAHVHPLTEGDYLLVAEMSFTFGRHGTIEKQRDSLIAAGNGSRFYIESPNPQVSNSSVSTDRRMVWRLASDHWVTIASKAGSSMSEADCRRQVDDRRKAYEKSRFRSGGILADGGQAASDTAAWNIVWNSRGNRPVASVAREFPSGSGVVWGGYIQGGWDAVFQALLADLQSPAMAEASILGLLADTTSNGFVPNAGTGWGLTENRSEPPLAAYAALKLYKEHGNRQFLEKIFPTLDRWHQWWPAARDGNRNGLLEWGADPVYTAGFTEFTNKEIEGMTTAYKRLGAQPPHITPADLNANLAMSGDESGLDNSPMWDGVKYNDQTHTMEQDDVGLSSLWALDGWALAEIANILGRSQDEQRLRQDFVDMSARVNKLMWSEIDGMYLNRTWNGTFNPRISPTNFDVLVAGIASPERATRMVQQYLLNPKKFWGEYVVPATPRDDPAFQDQNYWRGRIWGPTNYLVYEGLKRMGLDDVAADLASKSTALFLKEWQVNGHIHENYNSILGTGDDVIGSSVRYYAWGALLPLTMVEELIDVEPWGSGFRLGSLSDQKASVSNVVIGSDSYDVYLNPGLRVVRNGKTLLESDHPIVLRNVHWGSAHVHFDVTAKTRTRLVLYGFQDRENIRRDSNGGERVAVHGGGVAIAVDPATKTVDLLRNP